MRYCLILLLFLAVSGHADQRAAVMGLLQGYEWQVDQDKFDKLGPEVWKSLLEIARDDSQMGLFRARAMSALSLYPNDQVFGYYSERVAHASDPVERRRVVEAICETFGKSRALDLEPMLLPLLNNEDPHLRTKVARCVQEMGTTEAKSSLDAYRSRIGESWEAQAAGLREDNQ